jgi:hypothetical protein
MRDDPVAGLDHFAGDFGIAAFIGLVEGTAAEQDEKRAQRDEKQEPLLPCGTKARCGIQWVGAFLKKHRTSNAERRRDAGGPRSSPRRGEASVSRLAKFITFAQHQQQFLFFKPQVRTNAFRIQNEIFVISQIKLARLKSSVKNRCVDS